MEISSTWLTSWALLALTVSTAAQSPSVAPPRQDYLKLVPQVGDAYGPDGMFSKDGRFILQSDFEVTRLYDRATGKMLREFPGGFGDGAVLSPDGNMVVTASYGKAATAWDTSTGKPLRTIGSGHWVAECRFSSDGTRIVSFLDDDSVGIWDSASGHLLRRILVKKGLRNPRFVLEDHAVLCVCGDDAAKVWDASSGMFLRSFASIKSYDRFDTSPDGQWLANDAGKRGIQIWSVASGRLTQTLPEPTLNGFWFTPDSRELLAFEDSNAGRLWDVGAGRLVRLVKGTDQEWRALAYPDSKEYRRSLDNLRERETNSFPSVVGWPTEVQATSDRKFLLAGFMCGGARLWNLRTGALVHSFGKGGFYASISRDERMLLTSGEPPNYWESTSGQPPRLWDAATGGLIMSIQTDKNSSGYCDFFDKYRFILADEPNTVSLRIAKTGRQIREFRDTADDSMYESQEWVACADYDLLATTCSRNEVRGARLTLWDTRSGSKLWGIKGPNLDRDKKSNTFSVSFAPHGRTVAVWQNDGPIELRAARSGRVRCTIGEHSDKFRRAVFCFDAKRIVTLSEPGSVSVWDAATGRRIRSLDKAGYRLTNIAVDDRTARLATIGDNHGVVVWDLRTGELLRRIPNDSTIWSVVMFSTDGRRLLIRDESSIKIFDPSSGLELGAIYGFNDGTWAVVDASGHYDGSNDGYVAALHWVRGTRVYDVGDMRDRFYRKGLLAQIWNGAPAPWHLASVISSP